MQHGEQHRTEPSSCSRNKQPRQYYAMMILTAHRLLIARKNDVMLQHTVETLAEAGASISLLFSHCRRRALPTFALVGLFTITNQGSHPVPLSLAR